MARKYIFSGAQIKFIKKNYMKLTDQQLADEVKSTPASVRRLREELGLKKGHAFLARYMKGKASPAFLAHSFPKGHIPHTAGKHMEDWASPETIAKFRAHSFKKGNRPQNAINIGDTVYRYDKRTKRGYYYIKVAEGELTHNLMPLHRYNWEKVHGPIPPKHVLLFKDGNTENCDVSNLELMSYEENMLNNTIHRYPKDMVRAMRLICSAERRIKKLEKK